MYDCKFSTPLPGMVGLLPANTVFLTDHGNEILENCAKNVQLNAGSLNCNAVISVCELNRFNGWPPETSIAEAPFNPGFSWTFREIEQAENASILLAADVIYGDDLTDAFFSTLKIYNKRCVWYMLEVFFVWEEIRMRKGKRMSMKGIFGPIVLMVST